MNKFWLSIGILVVWYVVGMAGLRSAYWESLVGLTPLTLLLSLALALWNHPTPDGQLWQLLGLCFGVGLGVEVLGVQTGWVFGEYIYGEALGWKVLGTPLIIGVNWALLCYGALMLTNVFGGHWPDAGKAVVGATSMVALDVLIEPVAMAYGFWDWAGGVVPLQNYIAWWVIAFALLWVLARALGRARNNVGAWVFIMQFVFFAVLGF